MEHERHLIRREAWGVVIIGTIDPRPQILRLGPFPFVRRENFGGGAGRIGRLWSYWFLHATSHPDITIPSAAGAVGCEQKRLAVGGEARRGVGSAAVEWRTKAFPQGPLISL